MWITKTLGIIHHAVDIAATSVHLQGNWDGINAYQ
jgi:hypothetical protein